MPKVAQFREWIFAPSGEFAAAPDVSKRTPKVYTRARKSSGSVRELA